MTRKEKLIEIRKQLTSIGYEVLNENTPIEAGTVKKLIAPFVAAEKAIDRIIKMDASSRD